MIEPTREFLIENRRAYMTLGDLDKPFHRPECMCDQCEGWRVAKGRPTYTELMDKDSPPLQPRGDSK